MSISSAMPYTKRNVSVHGRNMAVVEAGTGDPIVFLHGNPTSSYLWRNILPHLEAHGRCIAPDLIGMGDSEKLPDSGPGRYDFEEHRYYLDGLLEALGVGDNVTLVLHDWGSALGFHWARRFPERIRGIAYMEAIVQPYAWADFGAQAELFQALRGSAGERMILEENLFVESVLPALVLRDLGEEEMQAYRRPFLEPGESRRPTLTWPRQIPIDGEPEPVVRLVQDYSDWLETAQVPKLFINAEPGAAISGVARDRCRRWPRQREVTVPGLHFIQEDSPREIGEALAAWYREL